MEQRQLQRNEKQVMELFWREGRPLTSLDLAALLDGAMSVSYLHKVLGALRKKGFIRASGVDLESRHPAKQFVPLLSKTDYVSRLIDAQELETNALAKIGVALVSRSAKSEEKQKELIESLEKMIETYRKQEE